MFPGIDAAAEDIVKMSASEARSKWGDTLTCSYTWADAQYTASLSYIGTCTLNGANIADNQVLGASNLDTYDVIMYAGSSSAGRFGWIRNVDITCPVYSDGYLRGGFMARVGAGSSLDPVFDNNLISDAPNNTFAGFTALSCNTSASSNLAYYYNVIYSRIPDGGKHTFRSITYLSDSGINADAVHFDNIQVDYYGSIYFCIICPYYGGDISVTAPVETTSTTTSGGGGTDINVNVDLTETNGILSGIKQSIDNLVQGVLDGLRVLFIPSDDFMDEFKSDMEELLADHLGGLYEAEQIMVDSFEQLPNVAAKSEIYIPPAELPLGGETFTIGGWHVPLKVSGLPAALYDGIAFIIDFLCIAAFLRMCRNKLEIFLNPNSEVIEQ